MVAGDAAYYDYLSRNLSWYYPTERWEYPIAADILVKENPKLFLEVGCGAGHFLRLARSRGYEGHGCELNPRFIETLREDGFHIVTELNHSISQYDAVLMFQVLEHLTDPYAVLKSLVAHIQPGGIIVLSTPITPSCVSFALPPFALPPHHQWMPTAQAFNCLAERLGLVCETILCDPPDYSQVVYAIRKWCAGLPYARNQDRYWNMAGRLTLKLATLMHCEWAKVGHTGMAVLRKPMTS
jgi:SAM-dependent methyltransferase